MTPRHVMAAPLPGTEDLPVATGENHYDFYVADAVIYDSNIYRLPSDIGNIATVVAPNASRSDVYDIGTVGVEGEWNIGLQSVTLNAHVDDSRFDRNTVLNNVGGGDNLVWNWRVGSLFSGQIGQDYSRSLASFSETLVLGRDIVGATDYYATARYQVGPHWAIFGGGTEARVTNDAPGDIGSNSNIKSGHAAVEYAEDIDRVFWLEYLYSNATYPPGFVIDNVLFNRDFDESKISLYTRYALTDKTVVSANAGFVRRNYPDASVGAFSGAVGRVTVVWQPTDKTQIAVAGFRELHAYLASSSDYFVSTGVSISPNWTASEKISLSLGASYENQRYIASSPSSLLLGARDDKITAVQANLQYTPTKPLTLVFSIRHEQRNSTLPDIDYEDELARARFVFKF